MTSSNGGMNWTVLSDMDNLHMRAGNTALFVHPERPERIFLGVDATGHIFTTDDGGINWATRLETNGIVQTFGVAPDSKRHLYALISRESPVAGETRRHGPLFLTDDWGESWESIAVIDTLHAYYDLYVQPNGALYLGTSDGVLINHFGAWTWINDGFDIYGSIPPAIYCITPDPTHRNVYAGMDYTDYNKPYRGGIYVRKLK